MRLCVLCLFLFYLPLVAEDSDLQLEKELCELADLARDTPARWKAFFVGSAYIQRLRAQLLRKEEISLEEMRKVLRDLKQEIELGRNFPPPPQAEIPFRQGASLTFDGIADEPAWAKALTYEEEFPINGRSAIGKAEWKLMYDREFLYFYAKFNDHDPQWNLERPYEADAFELFLYPDPRLGSYLELVFPGSPHVEQVYVRRVLARISRGTFDLAEITLPPQHLQYVVSRTEKTFSIEGKIAFVELPGYLLGNPPHPNESLHFMMLRTNKENGTYSRTPPVPFLYDGHNIFGYIQGKLAAAHRNPPKIEYDWLRKLSMAPPDNIN